MLNLVENVVEVAKITNYRRRSIANGDVCLEGAHKHFFDRDARPRTNLNYQKNRMTLNSNPEK